MSASGPTLGTAHCGPRQAQEESNLELHFRVAFIELVNGLGAKVRSLPGPNGEIITCELGGASWKLDSQVPMLGCRPDFLLTSSLDIPPVAIFTDGFSFHAGNVPSRNRLADDAAKRGRLRANHIHVIAMTFSDVDRYINHKRQADPPWFSALHAQILMDQFHFDTAALHTLLDGPFGWLTAWIQQPASAAVGHLADALPFLLTSGPAPATLSSAADLTQTAGALLRGECWPSAKGTDASWWWQQGHLGALIRWRGINAIDVALVLDDRPAAMRSDGYPDDWREWIRLSNWLTLRAPAARTHIATLSGIPRDER